MTTSAATNSSGRFSYPEGELPGATLTYHNSLPVLSVRGTPQDIGRAIGRLAMRPGVRMADYADDSLRFFYLRWLRRPLLWMGQRLLRQAPPDYLAEMEAMREASGVDWERLVLGNSLFDIKKFVACSAFLAEPAASATGQPLLGRNLDYPSRDYAHEYSLVTVYRPQGKKAFVSVGFPGLAGVLSGMNEDGLALAVLEVFQTRAFAGRLNLGGMPYAMAPRRVLETCSTVDEALERLQRTKRSTMFNLAVADRHRVAIFEITPRRVHERSPAEGVALCTNHFCLEKLQPVWSFNVYNTFLRHRALRRVRRAGEQFTVANVHAALHAARQDDTLQTMVFEPAALRLHLAIGELPASAGPLHTLELKEFLTARTTGAA